MSLNHARALVVLKKYLPPVKYSFINNNIEKDNEKQVIKNDQIKYSKKNYNEKLCPIWIRKNF
jgi:hypothetical protein